MLKKYYKYEFLELQAISFDELKKKEKKLVFQKRLLIKIEKKWNEILTNNQINLLNKKFNDDLKNLEYKIK